MQKIFSLLSRERNSGDTLVSAGNFRKPTESAENADLRSDHGRNFTSGVPGRPPDAIGGEDSRFTGHGVSRKKGENIADGDFSGGSIFWGNQAARREELVGSNYGRLPEPAISALMLEELQQRRFGEKGDFTINRDPAAASGVNASASDWRKFEELRKLQAAASRISVEFPPLLKNAVLRNPNSGVFDNGKVISQKRVSFSEATKGSFSPPQFPGIPFRPSENLNGVPVVKFTAAEVEKASVPLKWSLVGKFSKGRPALMEIFSVMKRVMNFQEDFFPVALDQRHILIRFQNRADFIKAYVKDSWWFKGQRMRCFRWTSAFSPGLESTLVPVWVGLRGMRAHMLDPGMISSIVAPIGSFLCCHPDVYKFSRPGYVMVCVEVDLGKPLLQNLLVDNGGHLVHILIDYIGLPPFCSNCKMVGHVMANCRKIRGNREGKKVVQGEENKDSVEQKLRNSCGFKDKKLCVDDVQQCVMNAVDQWNHVVFKKLRKKVQVSDEVVSPTSSLKSVHELQKSVIGSPGLQGNTPYLQGMSSGRCNDEATEIVILGVDGIGDKTSSVDRDGSVGSQSEAMGISLPKDRKISEVQDEFRNQDPLVDECWYSPVVKDSIYVLGKNIQCSENKESSIPSGSGIALGGELEDDVISEEVESQDPSYLPNWGVEDETSAATVGLVVQDNDSLQIDQQVQGFKDYESDTEIVSSDRSYGRSYKFRDRSCGLGEVTGFFD